MSDKFYQLYLTLISRQLVSLYTFTKRNTVNYFLINAQEKKNLKSYQSSLHYDFYNRTSREQATGLNWRRTGNLIGDKRT